jgi:TolB protein
MARPDRTVPLLALPLALLLAAPSAATDPEVYLGTTQSAVEKLDILVQPLEVVSGGTEAQEAAWLVESVIRVDLDYSGFFRALSVEDVGDSTRVQYAVEGLLEGRLPGTGVTAEERAPLLTLKLVAYPGRQLLLSKRYRPTWDRLRATAHHFVNELHLFLTMEPGISLTKVVFARGTGERRDIWCVDYDGENLLRLTANRTLNLFPAWSPDDEHVAFMSYREGQQGIYLLDTRTGRVRLVNESVGSNLAPAWHPEGKELLVSLSKVGQHEIYRLGLDGRVIRRLTVSPAIEIAPSWSPTGRDVIFTSDRTGTPQIYVMDADGSGRRRLTFEGRYNDAADWSPRGDQVIYACREDDITQIVLIEARGENRRLLTDASWRNCEDPSWAPDGRHIVFASDRTGVFKLYVMDVRDGTSRQLTFGEESDKTPDWSH